MPPLAPEGGSPTEDGSPATPEAPSLTEAQELGAQGRSLGPREALNLYAGRAGEVQPNTPLEGVDASQLTDQDRYFWDSSEHRAPAMQAVEDANTILRTHDANVQLSDLGSEAARNQYTAVVREHPAMQAILQEMQARGDSQEAQDKFVADATAGMVNSPDFKQRLQENQQALMATQITQESKAARAQQLYDQEKARLAAEGVDAAEIESRLRSGEQGRFEQAAGQLEQEWRQNAEGLLGKSAAQTFEKFEADAETLRAEAAEEPTETPDAIPTPAESTDAASRALKNYQSRWTHLNSAQGVEYLNQDWNNFLARGYDGFTVLKGLSDEQKRAFRNDMLKAVDKAKGKIDFRRVAEHTTGGDIKELYKQFNGDPKLGIKGDPKLRTLFNEAMLNDKELGKNFSLKEKAFAYMDIHNINAKTVSKRSLLLILLLLWNFGKAGMHATLAEAKRSTANPGGQH